MGCGTSFDHGDARAAEKMAAPVVMESALARTLALESVDIVKAAGPRALLVVLSHHPDIPAKLTIETLVEDSLRVQEVANKITLTIGLAAESYEDLNNVGSQLKELGVAFSPLGLGKRFFREFGAALVESVDANPPLEHWSKQHADAWRQINADVLGYIAAGVDAGRPAAPPMSLQKSAEIVKQAWQQHVAGNVASCGVKSYLSMFRNNPETLSVFFFRDSPDLARDGRMREHVSKSFTVTGQMINLAARPLEFRQKMEKLGAAHGMKGVSKEFVQALGRGILVMLAEVMEDDFSPEVEAAFKRVLKEVADLFDSGLKLWKSGAAPDASITGCAPPEFRRDYYDNIGTKITPR